MNEKYFEAVASNKTDIEVIKTKITHLEKWFFLFVTEFHVGMIGYIIFKISMS